MHCTAERVEKGDSNSQLAFFGASSLTGQGTYFTAQKQKERKKNELLGEVLCTKGTSEVWRAEEKSWRAIFTNASSVVIEEY
jgi:hypothetical protein